jgi:hypothetical protein
VEAHQRSEPVVLIVHFLVQLGLCRCRRRLATVGDLTDLSLFFLLLLLFLRLLGLGIALEVVPFGASQDHEQLHQGREGTLPLHQNGVVGSLEVAVELRVEVVHAGRQPVRHLSVGTSPG